MNVELTPEDAQNLIVFIEDYPAKGKVQEVAAILKQKLRQAIALDMETAKAPSHDGAQEEIPVVE